MRTIQRITIGAKRDGKRRSIIEVKLPKNSKILGMDYFPVVNDPYYKLWFDGTTEDRCEFETHCLGIFEAEQDMPSAAKRFHSRVLQVTPDYLNAPELFLYEFIIP